MEILHVPLIFNNKIIGYSGSNAKCRTIKFINEELNHKIFGDKTILLIALTNGDVDENGENIITQWVAEYQENVDNNNMTTLNKV